MNNRTTGKIVKRVLGTSIFLFLSCFSFATHQVGGYISFKWIKGTTYQVTVVDYTNTYLTTADRDTMRIHWGYDDDKPDGSLLLYRQNGQSNYLIPDDNFPNGQPLCNYDLNESPPQPLQDARKINIYVGVNTFPGPGNYRMWVDDPDRMAAIDNICGSVNVDYLMYTWLIIDPFADAVNSPVIVNEPVCQYGCTGEPYTYNPGAYIPTPVSDGDDSIVYSLGSSQCLAGECPCYNNKGATIDPVRGTLTWSYPETGIWNFVILMTTVSRQYVNVGGNIVKTIQVLDTVELELEVIINSECNPPTITSMDTCVVAGGNVDITYHVSSGISTYPVYITDAGEPFSLSPPATLSGYNPPSRNLNPVFKWTTNCSEVRDNPYEVVLRATEKVPEGSDNPPDTNYFRAYGTSLITVIAPAPVLHAEMDGTTVCLHWSPSPCPNDTGYRVYRHIGCSNWKHSYCETGVPSYTGYQLIATNIGINDTTYCDSNGGAGLSPGASYSYLVSGFYPLPDASQSYASNDTCITIKLDVPLITNVSVTQTALANGEMYIRWMRPLSNSKTDSNGIDTTIFRPPYQYILMRATGLNGMNFTKIETVSSLHYNSALDTTFMDTGLDTQDSIYNYKIDFYYTDNNGNLQYGGSSGIASSLYLRLQRGDQSMNLGWSASVPWTNDSYNVYRKAPSAIGYTFLAVTSNTSYMDTGLVNGYQYCYYVESSNHYPDANILHPLYDSSETICGIPVDTIPPCPPPLNITAKCNLYLDSIVWNNPNIICPRANKVASYQVFYSPTQNGDLAPIATITNLEDTTYVIHDTGSLAGCFAVIAIDSSGQTSPFNTICVDNCPAYELPNVFTPNEEINSLFTPIEPYRYVKDIDINIFNRWGQLMFHTTNPSINWNGKVNNTEGLCPDGVYYYICIVNEIRLTGIVPVTLKGFVQLIR
jgi:gliding motility-associated-like protein